MTTMAVRWRRDPGVFRIVDDAPKRYDPNEPRIPSGPGGGEWTTGGATVTEAQKRLVVASWQSTFEACRNLREGIPEGLPHSLEFVAAAMGEPEVAGPVYRGTKYEPDVFERPPGDDVGFSSWHSATPELDSALMFGKTILEISGAHAHDISRLSPIPSFKEAVFPPGRFRWIGSRAGPDGSTIVSLYNTEALP